MFRALAVVVAKSSLVWWVSRSFVSLTNAWVENNEVFFDAGKALSMRPPAFGKNIGILTDGGGPGIMTVDECISKSRSKSII